MDRNLQRKTILNALPFFQNIKNALTAGGTGGLTWHLHAALSKKQWLRTQDQIQAHLYKGLEMWTRTHLEEGRSLAQLESTRELVLIGASAGWMMSTPWLEEFTSIDAYDIDPLAPILFKLNHGKALQQKKIAVRFHNLDAIDQLDRVLNRHPRALIWFDNVLGQHRIRLKDSELASAQLKILQRRLQGRFWGSVHDLYSGPVLGAVEDQISKSTKTLSTKSAEVIRLDNSDQDSARVRFNGVETNLGQARQQFLHNLGATPAGGAWLDHETSKVFPQGTQLIWTGWDFKPSYCHCLEMGWWDGGMVG